MDYFEINSKFENIVENLKKCIHNKIFINLDNFEKYLEKTHNLSINELNNHIIPINNIFNRYLYDYNDNIDMEYLDDTYYD